MPLFAGGRRAARSDEVVVVDDLRADEAAFDVGVNLACRFGRRRAAHDRPGAALVRPCRQERQESQKLECRLDQTVESAFRKAEFFEEGLRVLRVEFGDFRLYARRDDDDFRAFLCRVVAHGGDVRISCAVLCRLVLGDVGDVEHGLQGKEVHLADER